MSGRLNMRIMYYYISFFLSILCFLSFLSTVNPYRMDAAAAHWHSSPYPLLLTDDFTREEEESNTGKHGDGSEGVHGEGAGA